MKIIDYAKFIIQEIKADIKIKNDLSKPDGTPRKIIDSKVARNYGWSPKVSLKKGFKETYLDFLKRFG